MVEAVPGQRPAYSTRSSSHTHSASRQASSLRRSSSSMSQIAVNTTMTCQAQSYTLDLKRTDTKKMSTISDEEDAHDHENDSAYGSATSPSKASYTATSHHQTKPSTSKPLPPALPSSTSSQNQNHSAPRSNHPIIAPPTDSRTSISNGIFDNPLDYAHLQRPGFGYSVTITGSYANKPDSSRLQRTRSRNERRKREASVSMPALTPEQVFGLAPIDAEVRNRAFGGTGGGGGGVGAAEKSLSAYERRMAKRDRFTLLLVQGRRPAG